MDTSKIATFVAVDAVDVRTSKVASFVALESLDIQTSKIAAFVVIGDALPPPASTTNGNFLVFF